MGRRVEDRKSQETCQSYLPQDLRGKVVSRNLALRFFVVAPIFDEGWGFFIHHTTKE